MREFKLVFPEIDQSYSLIDVKKTVKGSVKQTTGNIVTVLLNPKYCKAKKFMRDKFSMINLPMRLNFKVGL